MRAHAQKLTAKPTVATASISHGERSVARGKFSRVGTVMVLSTIPSIEVFVNEGTREDSGMTRSFLRGSAAVSMLVGMTVPRHGRWSRVHRPKGPDVIGLVLGRWT